MENDNLKQDQAEDLLADGSKPATPNQLFMKLDELGIETKTHHHEAVFTVEQSQHVTSTIEGAHTKNLFVKDKKDNYFLMVVGNQAKIPLNKIHKSIGAQSRVSFANADRLMAYLGVKPGSVNAFAPINDHTKKVTVIIDEDLLKHDQINCHPLINEMTTTILKQDLLRFLDHVDHKPQIIKLSEAEEVI